MFSCQAVDDGTMTRRDVEGWTGAGAQAHPSAVGTQLPQDFPEYEVGNVELTD